ncbi:FecR domain-containing protein [Limibacter armeniacum]|uniref:FecR family protein n=1 Tax=Limibacter armeniacum TaxID=466084 RepID=UPI002FE69D8A
MDKNEMEQLIAKYLNKELTDAEASDLKHWLEKDKVNRQVFENIVGQWHLSQEEVAASKVRVLQRIQTNQQVPTSTKTLPARSWFSSYGYRVAAVLLLGLGLALVGLLKSEWWRANDVATAVYVEKEAVLGQKLSFQLPDGSIVKLNAGSKLKYPSAFKGKNRDVQLTGEAFFDVARDEDHPFRIASNGVMVQVLGTSFNVRSYPDEQDVAVAVKTGKVAVSGIETKNRVTLEPAQMATYSLADQSINKKTIEANDPSVFGWVDKHLVFRDENFDVVLTQLSRWYGVEFKVEQKKNMGKRFTANFKNPSLVKVMESVSFVYGFNYKINGNRVTIY